MRSIENISIESKYCLTITEASVYFGIGEKKMRQLINDNKDADYLFYNGNKCLIKKKKFESYIDQVYSI